jgi:hypothetical protein
VQLADLLFRPTNEKLRRFQLDQDDEDADLDAAELAPPVISSSPLLGSPFAPRRRARKL